MTVPEPREHPPTADSMTDMGENGASKLAKATSTRSLLSISYRELSRWAGRRRVRGAGGGKARAAAWELPDLMLVWGWRDAGGACVRRQGCPIEAGPALAGCAWPVP